MAQTLSVTMSDETKANLNKTFNPGPITGIVPLALSYDVTLTSSQVSKVWSDTRTLTGSETFDLNAGLTDAFGTTQVFTSVKRIHVVNHHATATLNVGGGSTPVLGVVIPVTPLTSTAGGGLVLTSLLAVSGSTKLLKIDAGGSTITYDIIVCG